jgi:hypothetical protein
VIYEVGHVFEQHEARALALDNRQKVINESAAILPIFESCLISCFRPRLAGKSSAQEIVIWDALGLY